MLRIATPDRLSAFSDGVFAVLITVLVLDLRPPELPTFTQEHLTTATAMYGEMGLTHWLEKLEKGGPFVT